MTPPLLPVRLDPVTRVTALAAAAVLTADIVFQLSLAAGAPWGAAAWGGANTHLPAGLRTASGVAALVLVVFTLAVLRVGGWSAPTPVPASWLRPMVWTLAVFATLNTLGNLASRSDVERMIMTPAALTLAALCATVAWRTRRRS